MFTKTYPHVNFFPPVRGYEFALLEERILKEYDLRKHPWCWGSSCMLLRIREHLFTTENANPNPEPADNKEVISGQGGFFNYF
jgi:hypothetical protein